MKYRTPEIRESEAPAEPGNRIEPDNAEKEKTDHRRKRNTDAIKLNRCRYRRKGKKQRSGRIEGEEVKSRSIIKDIERETYLIAI